MCKTKVHSLLAFAFAPVARRNEEAMKHNRLPLLLLNHEGT